MRGPWLGNFELTKTCSFEGCEDPAERILILFDLEDEDMTVRCLCMPHAVHHESMFKDSEQH